MLTALALSVVLASGGAPTPPPDVAGEAAIAELTTFQLRLRVMELRRQRPSIGVPVALVSVGAPLATLSGLLLFGGLFAEDLWNVVSLTGLVGVAVSVPLIAFGAFMLRWALADRRIIDDELGALEPELRRREALERLRPQAPPLPPMQVSLPLAFRF